MSKIAISLLLVAAVVFMFSCGPYAPSPWLLIPGPEIPGIPKVDFRGDGTQLWLEKIPEPEKHIAEFNERSYCQLVAETMSEADPMARWFCY